MGSNNEETELDKELVDWILPLHIVERSLHLWGEILDKTRIGERAQKILENVKSLMKCG